jgi:hypothetical protein
MGVAIAGMSGNVEIYRCARLRRFGECRSILHREAGGNGCKQKVASIKHGRLPYYLAFC